MMKKRLISTVLVLCLLFAWFPIQTDVFAVEAEADTALTVLYIPLDNRPFNYDRAVLMAESLNIEILVPEEDWCATKLEGQTPNENGTMYGDRGRLFQFLKDHAEEADALVISLDQLLSGGLMNSRCVEEMQPMELPDGSVVTEYDVIDYLGTLAATKPMYIIDSVLRFATSNEFAGFELKDYTLTRKYGIVSRPVLVESELTVENVLANYRLAQDGTEAYFNAGFSETELSYFLGSSDTLENGTVNSESEDSLLARYLRIRERKLRLVDYALRTLCGMENVSYLLGVDDSAGGNTIHTNEIAYFKTLLHDENDEIFSAMDGLAQTAIAQAYLDCVGGQGIQFSASYFGTTPDQVGTFNFINVEEMVEQTIAYHGGVLTSAVPDISFLVYCSTGNPQAAEESISALIAKIQKNEEEQIPTILLDLSSSEKSLMNDALLENIHLGMLLCYIGNAEGTMQVNMALSQGIARYQYLVENEDIDTASQQNFLKSLLWGYVDEYYRTNGGKAAMSEYLAGLGYYGNMGDLTEELKQTIHAELTTHVQTYCSAVLENFASSNFISSLAPYGETEIESAEILSCEYPWLRQFEFSCELACNIAENIEELEFPFIDVVEADYYYEPVFWAVKENLVVGMTPDTFEPLTECNRAMIVTLLWRLAGEPQPEGTEQPFTDVEEESYYYDAVLWSAEQGIVRGMTDTTFEPATTCTRAMVVTLLWRLAGEPQPEGTEQPFTDVEEESYYYDPVLWAVENHITQGMTPHTFCPNAPCLRGQIVTFLYRYCILEGISG